MVSLSLQLILKGNSPSDSHPQLLPWLIVPAACEWPAWPPSESSSWPGSTSTPAVVWKSTSAPRRRVGRQPAPAAPQGLVRGNPRLLLPRRWCEAVLPARAEGTLGPQGAQPSGTRSPQSRRSERGQSVGAAS